MSIKEILNSLTKRIMQEESKEETCDNNQAVKLSYPNVVIDDTELVVTLGQWMRCLHDSDLEEIKIRFANLLKKAGFTDDETVVLSDFDENKLTFSCNLPKTQETGDMAIRFGSFMDSGSELIVNLREYETIYEYSHAHDGHPDTLSVNTIRQRIGDTDKKFYHFVSEYTYYGDVYDNENKVSVKINYPEPIERFQRKNPYIDKELMKEILSAVTFPVDIESLCNKLATALLFPAADYPSVCIKVAKMKGNEELEVTDEAVFHGGNFVLLTITKNGKKITIDHFDNWTYTSPEFSSGRTADNQVNYGFNSMPLDKIKSMPNPLTLFENSQEEVNEVRGLAKTLLHKGEK